MRNYSMLSDHDFELLAASILEAERGGRWEVFARGGDGGVDVRHSGIRGSDVVQCKHMLGSTFSNLKTEARKEKKNVDKMARSPSSYQFWTTKPLSQANKRELMIELSPWIKSESDIWGQEDIELALNKYPAVERGHVKLWIAGAGQLSAQLNAGIWERSRELAIDIEDAMPRYVETGVFDGAQKMLEENRVLIISGPPGVGKSTIARLLVANAALDGYEPILISSDVAEGQQVLDRSRKQIFYYDDFLGSNFLSNRLDKNEDKRLASFIRACQQADQSKFVMTTREYVLLQAVADYEELKRAGVHLERLVVQMEKYSRVERARILYNHLYHSPNVGPAALSQLREGKAYRRIVDHRNYNPRLVEFATFTDPRLREVGPENFATYISEVFDNPDSVWRTPFDTQVDPKGQALIVLLACVPGAVTERAVYEMLNSAAASGLCEASHAGDLEKILKVLDDSFLSTNRGGPAGGDLLVGLHNPSIADFVAGLLSEERTRRNAVIGALTYFEQATWIFDSVRDSLGADTQREFDDLICEAHLRLFDQPVPKLVRDFAGIRPSQRWAHSDPVERLRAVERAIRSSARCREILAEPFERLLVAQAELWREDPCVFSEETCSDIVSLLGDVGKDALPPGIWEAACDLINDLESSSTKWELLGDLGEIDDPDVDHMAPHLVEFEMWFDRLLDGSVDEVSLRELDEAHLLANSLSVDFDAELFDRMHNELAYREDALEDHRYGEWKDSGGLHSDREVGAIFER